MFAFYIVHQTALIAFAVWIRPLQLRPLVEGPPLVVVVAWLRPLFGLKASEPRSAGPTAPDSP